VQEMGIRRGPPRRGWSGPRVSLDGADKSEASVRRPHRDPLVGRAMAYRRGTKLLPLIGHFSSIGHMTAIVPMH
jgi:hypothetical protein